MSQITCVLDACSIINLIHIDEDDFLIKKLKNIDYYLCQKVFKEVNNNVFDKLNKIRKGGEIKGEEVKARKEEIDKALNVFRNNQKLDDQIKHELGDEFFDEVKKLSGYSKDNGELYSTALALFLSRCKPLRDNPSDFMPTKLFFYTDDYPAKNELASFYLHQQIGYIEDTADLLVLLYRLDDDFTSTQLNKILSNLFAEYASEVTLLEKKLRELRSNVSINLAKDKLYVLNLNLLINKLHKLDFTGINKIKEHFFRKKSKYGNICELLKNYESVFDLEITSISLLHKIKLYRKQLKKIYKV